VDVTAAVREAVHANGWQTGAVLLYCPHTTGAVTVNEGADPDVAREHREDHEKTRAPARRLRPRRRQLRRPRQVEPVSASAQLVPVEDGEVQLGTWQHIFFCEFDGPRERSLCLAWLPGV